MKNTQNERGKKALKKLGILLLNFALFYLLWQLIIALSVRTGQIAIYYVGAVLYAIVGSGSAIGFFVLNGFSFDNRDREEWELPEKWSEEQKAEYLTKQRERRERGKKLIYILLPMLLVIAVDYIELMFFS